MKAKQKTSKASADRVVNDIRRATRKQYSAEEKICIVLEGLRGDDSIAELCRKEGIAEVDPNKPDRLNILLHPELSAQPDRQSWGIKEVMSQGIPDLVQF